MDAFFSGGGTTQFIDRLTASLGIHASTVKIVSVYEGSLVVNYEIGADDPEQLESIAAKQNEVLTSNSVDLGAPVLAVEAKISRNVDPKGFGATVSKTCSTTDQSGCVNPDLELSIDQQVA